MALEVLFVEHLAGELSARLLVRDMDDLIGSASQTPTGRGAWGLQRTVEYDPSPRMSPNSKSSLLGRATEPGRDFDFELARVLRSWFDRSCCGTSSGADGAGSSGIIPSSRVMYAGGRDVLGVVGPEGD